MEHFESFQTTRQQTISSITQNAWTVQVLENRSSVTEHPYPLANTLAGGVWNRSNYRDSIEKVSIRKFFKQKSFEKSREFQFEIEIIKKL